MNYAAAVLGATDPLLPGRRGPQARIVAIDPLRKPRFYQLLRYSFVLVLAYCRGLYEDAPRDIFSLVCLPQDHDPPYKVLRLLREAFGHDPHLLSPMSHLRQFIASLALLRPGPNRIGPPTG